MTSGQKNLARFAWATLAVTVGVVLWGAYVRATGAGAGCGAHWPLCNGEVVPRTGEVKTLVEFTHRVTSGLAGLMALGMLVWAFVVHRRGSPVRKAAGWTFAFMVTEALIGAGLVLFELVAENASMARAYWMSAHLVNTFLLLGAMTLAADLASGRGAPRARGQGPVGAALGAATFGLVLLGVSGAITALGDTLFPAQGLAEGLAPAAHVLLKLRLFHPALAIVVGLGVVGAAWFTARTRGTKAQRRHAVVLTSLVGAQLGAGFVNVLLLAPVWMQLVHLLLADLLWIAFVRGAASALADPAPLPEPVPVEGRTALPSH